MSPPPRPFRLDPRVLKVVLVGVLAPLGFVTAFALPSHDPRPDGLKVAVVGSPAAARLVVRPLGDVTLQPESTRAAAERAIRHHDVYGAVVSDPKTSVEVASGSSFVVASELRQGATVAAVAPARVRDLAALPSGDPRGSTLNLALLALLITSITGAALAVGALPKLKLGAREALLLAISLTVGAGTVAILKALSALPGPFVAEAALLAALVFSVALVAGSLVRLRGSTGVTLGFLAFLMVANPASGAASAPALLPTPWHEIGPLMPPGALVGAMHATAYFGGASAFAPVLVLVGWMAIGVAANVGVDLRQREPGARRRSAAIARAAPAT